LPICTQHAVCLYKTSHEIFRWWLKHGNNNFIFHFGCMLWCVTVCICHNRRISSLWRQTCAVVTTVVVMILIVTINTYCTYVIRRLGLLHTKVIRRGHGREVTETVTGGWRVSRDPSELTHLSGHRQTNGRHCHMTGVGLHAVLWNIKIASGKNCFTCFWESICHYQEHCTEHPRMTTSSTRWMKMVMK